MLPSSPPTDPDVQISRIRFFAQELRSRGVSMDDPRLRQWIAHQQRREASPWDWLRARPAFQPFPPGLCDLSGVVAQLQHVPRDAVVGVVTHDLHREPRVLAAQRLMPVFPTPVTDRNQRPCEPALRRPLPNHILAARLRFPPRVGEAEEVERWPLAIRVRAALRLGPEVDEARFVGVEREPVPT